jgi:deferrochelatase/peroxidase EfeB
MGARPVTRPDGRQPTWKLRQDIAELTQGLVVNGFKDLPTGRALLLRFGGDAGLRFVKGGAWLQALRTVAPVTPAVPPNPNVSGPPSQAVALAFTWAGLQCMKLPPNALASFSRPFREGMFQEDRLRRLGDLRADRLHPNGRWQQTVISGGPIWSANTPPREPARQRAGAYDVLEDCKEHHVTTPETVHALLLLYAPDEQAAEMLAAKVKTALEPHGVVVVREREIVLDVQQGSKVSHEHFGFADGLSQPEPYDEEGAVTLNQVSVLEADRVQGVPLGEFLIGYRNGHRERAPGPVVPDEPQGLPARAGLSPHPEAEGFHDFGLNGSYLVVRELRQDVASFWQSMDQNTAAIRQRDPDHSGHVTAEWLAERVVGRSQDGHLLCPAGRRAPDIRGFPDNSFLFHADDPHGIGCPVGSHVRRAHPRDALARRDLKPQDIEAARRTALAAANNHRILRRGRKFGPRIDDPRRDDGKDRGLLFLCLNTDIARQFEFIQQTWLLNSDFATLHDEVDPLVGPDGRMTVHEEPLRRTFHVRTYVQMAGGDYFFLPSLPALRYLEEL